jgi:hypothetical protein
MPTEAVAERVDEEREVADTRLRRPAIAAVASDDRGERVRRRVRQERISIRQAKGIRHVHESLRS